MSSNAKIKYSTISNGSIVNTGSGNIFINPAPKSEGSIANKSTKRSRDTFSQRVTSSQRKKEIAELKASTVQWYAARQKPKRHERKNDYFPTTAAQTQSLRKARNQKPNYILPHDITIDTSHIGFLGSGGFGKVRIGKINAFGTVAVKCVSLLGFHEEKERMAEQIMHEIQMHLLQRNHKNVVNILGYFSIKNYIAIVMDYMAGGDLQRLLLSDIDDSNIPFTLRLRFCADISSGVTYLHNGLNNTPIVHGDIKHANILLTANLDCKIADFGGAQLATLPKISGTGFQYTKGFVAPERLESFNDKLSKASDVYSVGATFYAIIRRRFRPFCPDNFQTKLSECTCPLKSSKKATEHFSLIKEQMLNCCEPSPENRMNIIEVRDFFLDHDRKCVVCGVAKTAKQVASLLQLYKVNTTPKEFFIPKMFSEISSQKEAKNKRLSLRNQKRGSQKRKRLN